jgi:galactoside O-acetyltransferase
MGLLRLLGTELDSWIGGLISLLPYGVVGNWLRRQYWSVKLGGGLRDVDIFPGVQLIASKNIRLGLGVSINRNVIIDASHGEINIGDNVAIGPNTVLRAADHVFSNPNELIKNQGHKGGYIRIEEDSWLGTGVVVLRNVTVGKGSVIGAGAVVTRDVPPFSIAAGVPARVIGKRE